MVAPPALLGLDIGELVEDAVRALVDLVVPDFGADWVAQLVTWLVALPAVTGGAFPALNRYATELSGVGFGLLGACCVAGLLQLWASGFAGGSFQAGVALRKVAVAAGMLAAYPLVLKALLVGVNILTAAMIRHPLVRDGLDDAFGQALVVGAVSGGLSLGLAAGAAVVVLYFVAALVVLKIALTAVLGVVVVSGALVWGLYPLPQADWLPRAWLALLVSALIVPITWACVFSAATLLAADTLVFDGDAATNRSLGDALAALVKPFAAVACFWVAYRTPFLLGSLARSAGLSPSAVLAGAPLGATGAGGPSSGGRRSPEALARQAVTSNADRFRALAARSRQATARTVAAAGPRTPKATGGAPSGISTPARRKTASAQPAPSSSAGSTAGRARDGARRAATAARRANDWWRALPDQAATPTPAGRGAAPGARARPRAQAPRPSSGPPRAARRVRPAMADTSASLTPRAARSPSAAPSPLPASALTSASSAAGRPTPRSTAVSTQPASIRRGAAPHAPLRVAVHGAAGPPQTGPPARITGGGAVHSGAVTSHPGTARYIATTTAGATAGASSAPLRAPASGRPPAAREVRIPAGPVPGRDTGKPSKPGGQSVRRRP